MYRLNIKIRLTMLRLSGFDLHCRWVPLKRSWFVICYWWISIHFVCLCVSRFVACDRNYDWRQRKTQLWRRLLNFRVRMFVKSAVMTDWITAIHWSELGPRYFSVYYIIIFQCFISAVELPNPSLIFFCPIWRIETVKVYERSLFKFP